MEQTSDSKEVLSDAPAKRPVFLTVLCILSYIGSSLWMLFSLHAMFFSTWIIGMAVKLTTAPAAEDLNFPGAADLATAFATAAIISEYGTLFIIGAVISFVLALLSITGVTLMWKTKKIGFWIYSVSNAMVMCMLIWLDNNNLLGGSILSSLITIGFITMYSINLKHMK